MLNVTAAIEITSATGATGPLSHYHTWIRETQWAYSVQLANLTHGVH